MRLLRFTVILAGLASTSAFAGGKEELGKKVLETSGLKKQFTYAPQLVEGALQERRAEMSPEKFDAFARHMRALFAPESFYPAMEAGFLKAIDEKALRDLDRWYRTPFGKRLAELDEKASRPESQEELEQFAQSMETSPPPAARVRLIQRIDEAMHGTELTVALMTNVFKSILRGKAATEGKPAREPTDEELRAMRTQLEPELRNMNQVSLLYTYRSLSDQELKDFLKHLSTPSAQAFTRAINKGFEAAFDDAAVQVEKKAK